MLRRLAWAVLFITIVGITVWGSFTYNSLLQARSDLNPLGREIAALQIGLESTQRRLVQTEEELASAESQLQLYRDTWGLVFAHALRPDLALYPAPSIMKDLVNNDNASDPTWAELVAFLLEDQTDQNAYRSGVYDCGGFAVDVHNNAERAGIRAAFVYIYLAATRHAFNAFKTTDRGLVFICCTGSREPQPDRSYDKVVDVQLGGNYALSHIFPEGDWVTQSSWGTVTELMICW